MKYALIGCGRISPNHIEAAKNNHLDFVAMNLILFLSFVHFQYFLMIIFFLIEQN